MGGGTYTYHATKPHAVIGANGNSYAYDAVGNMTTRNSSTYGNQTLTYDEQNRLKQVAISGGSTVQFGYSAGGSRLWKKVDGQITGLWIGSLYEEKDGKILCHVYAGDRLVATFEPESALACIIQNNRYLAALWNGGDWALTAFFGGGRTLVTVMWAAALAGVALSLRYNRRRLRQRYGLQTYYGLRIFGGTDPWRQMVLLTMAAAVFLSSNPQAAYADTPTYDPVFYYYHPDHLGSCQLMTDRNGELVQQYGYTPFGEENYQNNTSAFDVSSRYTGQTLDEDTGLYYYGARYYDPELARFIQADSTVPDPEFSQAYNRYAYVYNNPLKFTDPLGQMPFLVGLAISMGISGGIAAATGGNVLQGMLMGAFCYGIGAATGGLLPHINVCGWGLSATGAAIAGGAIGGAVSATITGGRAVLGAVMGGLSAGAGIAMQDILPGAFTWIDDTYLRELAVSTTAGALIGGVTAEMMGGDFGQGAAYGAAGAAAGCVVEFAIRVYVVKSVLGEMARTGEIPDWLMGMDLAMSYTSGDYSTSDEGLVEYYKITQDLNPQPIKNPLARKVAGLFKRLGIGWNRHHTVPREILKSLPKEVANNPLVRGVKGAPNRWSIPTKLHKAIHRGAGGGGYNAFWKKNLNAIYRAKRTPTVQDVLRIRQAAIKEFGLGAYAP